MWNALLVIGTVLFGCLLYGSGHPALGVIAAVAGAAVLIRPNRLWR